MNARITVLAAFLLIAVGYFYENLSTSESIGLAMLNTLITIIRNALTRRRTLAHIDRVLMREARARVLNRLA